MDLKVVKSEYCMLCVETGDCRNDCLANYYLCLKELAVNFPIGSDCYCTIMLLADSQAHSQHYSKVKFQHQTEFVKPRLHGIHMTQGHRIVWIV